MGDRFQQADSDGRYPISYREYEAIRNVFGAVNSFVEHSGELERRCKQSKNLWRDMRLLCWLSEDVLTRILSTVPIKRLGQISEELKHTHVRVEVDGVVGRNYQRYMYVEQEALIDLCRKAVDVNCFGCEKTHKEAKRKCQLYKDIQSMFNYEFDEFSKGENSCPFCDGGI